MSRQKTTKDRDNASFYEKLVASIESTYVRVVLNVTFTILSGILCSAFVTEITVNNKLNWSSFYRCVTFYIIFIISLIFSLYQKAIIDRELEPMRFADAEFCRGYVLHACLPELSRKYKNDIARGHKSSDDLFEMVKKMDEVMKP